MRQLRFSYSDLYKLPVRYRSWFIDKLAREMNRAVPNRTGGIELDDDTPISQVLTKMNKYD